MKRIKRILSVLLAAALLIALPGMNIAAYAAGEVTINETNFPDAAFRSYVKDSFDTDQNGILSQSERNAVTDIDCAYRGISSMKGLEYFTALESLNCCSNSITALNVSKNTALRVLSCFDNQIGALDLAKNTALEVLHCYDNLLTTLDLSRNTNLSMLWCFGNQLSSLNLAKNTALTELDCSSNQFTTLDLTQNTRLEQLLCAENQLQTLNLTKNTALAGLFCSRNYLGSIDLSKNTALVDLSCSENLLTALELSRNAALESLNCERNQLQDLNLSKNTALTSVMCSGNALRSLNLSGCGRLSALDCADNRITLLDLTACPVLCSAYREGEAWDDGEGHLGYAGDSGFLFLDAELPVASGSEPVFVSQPKDVTAAPNSAVVFQTEIFSKAAPSLQWQYRESGNSTWYNCTGEGCRTATYIIKALDYRSGYAYRCRATNASGTVFSKAAVLTVVPMPYITQQPKSQTAVPGSTAVFRVKAEGENLNYRWQYQTGSGGSWYNCTTTGCNSAELSVEAKDYRDGYRYRCILSNTYGSATSAAATLTIQKKPVIKTQPQSISAETGAWVSFRVSASGKDLSYDWQYRMNSSDYWYHCTNGNTASLNLEARSYRSGYQYRCVVKNDYGTVYSNVATLTVLPGILTQPQSVSAEAGSKAVFKVTASGDGLHYQWQYRTGSSGSWNNCTVTGATTAALSVVALTYRDGYQYRCAVTNDSGTTYSGVATLHVW